MADGAQYVSSDFKLKATFDNGAIEFTDVVALQANFALNAIPQATLIVASGKDYVRGEIATIHKVRDQLKHRMQVTVTLEIRNHGGQTFMMDAGEYVVFEGYLAGIGFQRAYDSVSYTLHLIHWLDDLNCSSMINGNWYPGAPYDMAQNAGYYALTSPTGEGGGPGTDVPSMVPSIDPQGKLITIANIQNDLWGKVIQPIFTRIAGWPSPRDQKDSSPEKNDAALKALDRMPPKKAKANYSPLALNLGAAPGANLELAVRDALGKSAAASYAYTTFWNKLVGEYAPQFYFAISPAVEHASPIPFFAGLRDYYVEIDSKEYGFSSLNANMSQIIESVDVFYPVPSDSGLIMGGNTPPGASFRYPLGWFPEKPSDDAKRGMKILKEPPAWITNIVPYEALTKWTTGVGGPTQPGDTAFPQNGPAETAPVRGQKVDQSDEIIAKIQNGGVMKKFAEHWYKTEVLFQRHGELSGKLRLDIAPGTTVKINTPPYDMDNPNLYESLFASVTQVSFVINAEKATAGTSFTLAHIRNKVENESDIITSLVPPLYKQSWSGGPLADAK